MFTKYKATGDSINKDQIGYAYAFGKGDAVAALQDNYWTDEGSEDGKEEVRLKMKEETGDSGDKRFRQEEMPKPQIKTRVSRLFRNLLMSASTPSHLSDRFQRRGNQGFQNDGHEAAWVRSPAGVRIRLTSDRMINPEIKIIGFHDPSNLAFFHNVKHSVFIYPNEKVSVVRRFATGVL